MSVGTSLSMLGVAAACILATPVMTRTVVYVSNSVDGDIDAYTLDTVTGSLSSLGKTPAGKVVMPMAISPDKRHLYAAVRSEPTRVLTFGIDASSGKLTKVAEAPLPDSMPNIATDRAGHFLFSASYSGDKLAVNPIDADGRVTKAAIQVIPTGHNAHSLQPDRTNRFAFASNLGSDQIVQFRFDATTGHLTPNDPPVFKAKPGEGPRHFAFSLDNKYLYVIHEMAGTVAQLAIDPEKGTLSEVSSVESVPPEAGLVRGSMQAPITAATMAAGAQTATATAKPSIWAADIQMTPDGHFLFTTERTSSKLAVLAIDPSTGRPRYVTSVATVAQPRGIKVDASGRFLVASGEKSDEVAVYRIDAGTGHLTEAARAPGGKGANWVEIVDLP